MRVRDQDTYDKLWRKFKKARFTSAKDELVFHKRMTEVLTDHVDNDRGPMGDGWDIGIAEIGGFPWRAAKVAELMNTLYAIPGFKATKVVVTHDDLEVQTMIGDISVSISYDYELFDASSKDDDIYETMYVSYNENDVFYIKDTKIETLESVLSRIGAS
jgi:hypothetical protein